MTVPQGEPAGPTMTADALATAHWDDVYRLLYRMTGHAHDAEELTQETFLRAIGKLGQVRNGDSTRAWVLRIATNCFFDARRKRGPGRLEDGVEPAADRRECPDSQAISGEVFQKVHEALLELPESHRAVFLLRVTEGLGFREIAETLGTNEATTRWYMLKAREKLVELLDGQV